MDKADNHDSVEVEESTIQSSVDTLSGGKRGKKGKK
jgi:hypothetical protein